MFQNGSFFRWLLGALLVIAVLAGVGYAAYHFGYVQGMANAPEIAAAISKAAESGKAFPLPPAAGDGSSYANPYMWGMMKRDFMPYGGWMPMHRGFSFFGGLLGLLLLGLLFFGLMRLIFRPRWYPAGPSAHPYWHNHPWGAPPWAQEGKEGYNEAGKKADTAEK